MGLAATATKPELERASCGVCDKEGFRLIEHMGTHELHRMKCACTYDLPVKFVYQLDEGAPNGCMLAAVAMATGIEYKELRNHVSMAFDFTTEGIGVSECIDLVDHLGFAYQNRYRVSQRLGWNAKRQSWPLAPWADRTFCFVKSLSNVSYHGVCLLRDGRVLDPWWGVIQGLHRYPEVLQMIAIHKVESLNG